MGKLHIWWKVLIAGIFFVLGLIIGVLVPLRGRPEINVIPYSPSIKVSPQQDFSLRPLGNLIPLVEAGPFLMAFDPETQDYLIDNLREGQPILRQKTQNDETSCIFVAKRFGCFMEITYRKSTGKVLRIEYAMGGITDTPQYTYRDEDGDGRFDTLIDYNAGVVYEQRGLEWVELRRFATLGTGVAQEDLTTEQNESDSSQGQNKGGRKGGSPQY